MRLLVRLALPLAAVVALVPAAAEAKKPVVTGAETLTFGPEGCSAKFVALGNGNVLETNRAAACGLSEYKILFVKDNGACPEGTAFNYEGYTAAGDPNLQGVFGTGAYNACFIAEETA